MTILLLLQARGRMTADELATEVEVSVRTIYRDIDALGAAGVPIYANAGHDGGYQLVDGYRAQLNGLTAQEAESLILASLPGPAAELGSGVAVAALNLKLQAAMPAELRERAAQIQARFHFEAPGWFSDGDSSTHLAEVAHAVWNQRQLTVRYRSWETEAVRQLEPLGLVLKGGVWYVVAHGPDRDSSGTSIRTYRVNQILDLTTHDETFEPPCGFELRTYWQTSVAEFRERLYTDSAQVRITLDGLTKLRQHPASPLVDSTPSPVTPDSTGWLEIELPIETLQHAEGLLLSLGADVEVLRPAELRDRILATSQAPSSTTTSARQAPRVEEGRRM